MEFRRLEESDASVFAELIKDMYRNLENLEWFSPMPYEKEGVKEILLNPRFFVLGAFDNGKLCAVSSFDFKCGKLIGQSFMPTYCNLDNTAEIAFTMVESDYKGQGIMKILINQLETQALKFNKNYLFGKVHIDNLASYKSFIRCDFEEFSRYNKMVNRAEFEQFLISGLLSATTLQKAKISLNKNPGEINVQYAVLLKKLQ